MFLILLSATILTNIQSFSFPQNNIIWIYKDFGPYGLTFSEALIAPEFYSDLACCSLAPVYTLEDLLNIQAVIPPKKAAYTAVYKEPVQTLQDTEDCYGQSRQNCIVEDYLEGFEFFEESPGFRLLRNQRQLQSSGACASLRKGWVNYGNDEIPVPESAWWKDEPTFCGKGSIQNVGAVWPLDMTGSNPGDLRDVNVGWYLPGAVYICCRELVSCFLTSGSGEGMGGSCN